MPATIFEMVAFAKSFRAWMGGTLASAQPVLNEIFSLLPAGAVGKTYRACRPERRERTNTQSAAVCEERTITQSARNLTNESKTTLRHAMAVSTGRDRA